MNLLIQDVNDFVDFLNENSLTADQFLFCVLLSSESSGYEGLPDREKAVSNFYKYYNTVAKHKENEVWTKQDLKDLLDKEFIRRTVGAEKDSFFYDDFEVTTEFLDLVFEEKATAMDKFQEFWNAYPARYESDGKSFNIKAVNKEEMYNIWREATKDVDPDTLLKALKIANSKDEVDCRIDKWLNSHQWEAYMGEIQEGVEPEDNPDIEQTVL